MKAKAWFGCLAWHAKMASLIHRKTSASKNLCTYQQCA